MKALLLHVNKYKTLVESPSSRIGSTEPEILRTNIEEMDDCLLILFQVEENDSERQVSRLCKDVRKIASQVGTQRLMVGAFAHLSHSRPDPEIAKAIAFKVVNICKSWKDYEVSSSHFGHNKATTLDVKGHQHAVKHRSY